MNKEHKFDRGMPEHLRKNREKYIMDMRFGRKRKATLQDIGDTFGLTRERVRQIIEKAKDKKKNA